MITLISDRERELMTQVEALKANLARAERAAQSFGRIIGNHCMAMQAALIDEEMNSPSAGLQWIFNTLYGPGLLPDMDEARKLGGAQAWFDAETLKEEARIAAMAVQS